VLLPAAKDAVSDAVSQGMDRLIFGESRRSGSRSSSRPGTSGYTAYNRYSSTAPWKNDRREDPRTRDVSRKSRASHDFGEILLGSRIEADDVIEKLYELCSQYGQATVADMYDLVGITPQFTDEKWGWTEMQGADIKRTRDGYVLILPRPETL